MPISFRGDSCTYKFVRVTLDKCKAMALMSGINNMFLCTCLVNSFYKKMLSIGQGQIWAFVVLKGK